MAIPYHESQAELSAETKNVHRALSSLVEELEAVDWYNQRVAVTDDAELKAVLAHNRDEEMEHASMILEWLRRRVPTLDEHLRAYLFTTQPITQIEKAADAGGDNETKPEPKSQTSLGIGSLRKENQI